MTPPESSLRALGVLRATVGIAWCAGLAAGRPESGATLPVIGRTVAGVLAMRDVAQGASLIARPSSDTAVLGAAIDSLHALSLVPVLALSRRWRQPALASAAEALAWVGAAAIVVRQDFPSAARRTEVSALS